MEVLYMYGYIYKIINKINGKVYVGKTEDTPELRFNEHLRTVKRGVKQSKLYSAIKCYGPENFMVEELDTANSRDELNQKEKYWIEKLDSRNPNVGYNVSSGGDGGATWSAAGYITMNKDNRNTFVKPDDVEQYLNNGWKLGGRKLGKSTNRSTGKWIHQGDKQKRVYEYELEEYLNNGWEIGYCDKAKVNLSKSHLGQIPVNKGVHQSEEQKLKTSVATKEAMHRPEVLEKMEKFYASRRGKIMVSNSSESLYIEPSEVGKYLKIGYYLGRRKRGDVSEES